MIRQCNVCGKDFKTYPSKIKIGRGKYCSKACCLLVTNKILTKNGKATRIKKGSSCHNYKGKTHTISRPGGRRYILVHMPLHPYSDAKGYIREHRLVAEDIVGRYIYKYEVVHHIDGNTENNDINNLEVMTKKEHDTLKN